MSKSFHTEITSPGETTGETGQKNSVLSKGLSSGKFIAKTGKSLVQNTVDFAVDITRRGPINISNDNLFDLDQKQDKFGSGNLKIFLKNQTLIPSTFARLANNDASLAELSFCNIELHWKEFNLLASAIQQTETLRKLSFYKSDINDGNAKELGKGIMNNSGLQELMFHRNRLTEKGSCFLLKAIGQNKTVHTVGFFKNKMGRDAMESLRQATRDNPKIDSIHLFRNEIGQNGSDIIAGMIESKVDYISLSLSYNNLGDMGTFAIAEQLQYQKNLLNLSLSGNGIGIDGTHSLVEALKYCPTILKLDLSGNKMKDDGCLEIVDQLTSKESSLQELDMSYNEITEVGALTILKRLQQNTSLQSLKLKESELKNDAVSEKIKTLMKRNRHFYEDKKGIKKFGLFYYITAVEREGKENTFGNMDLYWTDQAWNAAEMGGCIIALFHEELLKLHNLSKSSSFFYLSNDKGDEGESLDYTKLKSSFIASMKSPEDRLTRSVLVESKKISRTSTLFDEEDNKSTYVRVENTSTLAALRSIYESENIKHLLLSCEDKNGNTIIKIAKENKTEETVKFVRFIMQTYIHINKDYNKEDSDQASTYAATLANTVDDSDYLGENAKFILGRYSVENYPNRPMHQSDKSRVYSAFDLQTDSCSDYRQVALKFFDEKDDFEKELSCRVTSRCDLLSGNDLIFTDNQKQIQNKNKFDGNFVIPIIRFHEEECCIVMPLGDRNLEEIIRNEVLAGNDLKYIRDATKDIALSLRHLHEEHKMIHGDIRPLNFVRHNGRLKIADLQEASHLNDNFETNRSTGYVAPELAKKIFSIEESRNLSYWANEEKKIMKKILKLDRTNEQDQEQIQNLEKRLQKVKPHIRRNSLLSTMSRRGTEDVNVASVALDIWSFGVLSYYLLVGSRLFACDQQDNIHKFDIDEQEKLVFWSGLSDVAKSRINFQPDTSSQLTNVIDLLCRCLHPDHEQRIPDINQILNHAFLTEDCNQSTCMDEACNIDIPEKIPVESSPFISFSEKRQQRKLSMKSVMSSLSIPELNDRNESLFDPDYSTSIDIDITSVELNVRQQRHVIWGICPCIRR